MDFDDVKDFVEEYAWIFGVGLGLFSYGWLIGVGHGYKTKENEIEEEDKKNAKIAEKVISMMK